MFIPDLDCLGQTSFSAIRQIPRILDRIPAGHVGLQSFRGKIPESARIWNPAGIRREGPMTPNTSHIILYQSMTNHVIILAAHPASADEGMMRTGKPWRKERLLIIYKQLS
jgi:hypothetical protein